MNSRNGPSTATIYHITTDAAFAASREHYVADSLAVEGFIHCSNAEQVAGTLRRFFAGKTGLLLLEIDAALLGPKLVHEEGEPGVDYPHVYGPIPLATVRRTHKIDADGRGLPAECRAK